MPRELKELMEVESPAWPMVMEWLQTTEADADALPARPEDCKQALVLLQVTASSVLGALALHTSGLSIDGGWLRVLGGHELAGWNGLGAEPVFPGLQGGLVVGHDAVGGFFAIDGGGLGGAPGEVMYLAPDSLGWESLGVGHAAWVQWCIQGNRAQFYESLRWTSWAEDCLQLDRTQGFSFYPFLWTREGSLADSSRGVVPQVELLQMALAVGRQLD